MSNVMTSYEMRRYTIRVAIYVVLAIFTIIFLTPVYLVVVTALKDPATINLANTWNLPESLYIQSFDEVIVEFGPRIQNSVALVIAATAWSSVLGSPSSPRSFR